MIILQENLTTLPIMTKDSKAKSNEIHSVGHAASFQISLTAHSRESDFIITKKKVEINFSHSFNLIRYLFQSVNSFIQVISAEIILPFVDVGLFRVC